MAIDIYSVPVAEQSYVRQNLFSDPTPRRAKDSIGVNIYQDLGYTQADGESYFAMTTGATVVLNQWAEFGIFCSYWLPKTKPIDADTSPNQVMYLSNMFYCGNTIGFIPWADKVVHPKIALDVGFTTASATQFNASNIPRRIDYPILILKPAIMLETNILSFLQWTFGIRYRFQIGIHGPSESGHLDSKANWAEFTTGPVFNLR